MHRALVRLYGALAKPISRTAFICCLVLYLCVVISMRPSMMTPVPVPTQADELFDEHRTPVWVWWNYPEEHEEISAVARAAQLSWARHIDPDKFQVIRVTKKNLAKYIPDLPKEFDRLPYQACEADVVRAFILGHHGGIYLDTDFLLMSGLDEFNGRLKSHSFVSYQNEDQNCHGDTFSFSSNFMGAQKGNAMCKRWMGAVREAMARKCEDGKDMACCYHQDHSPRKCSVPWASLGEKLGHPSLKYATEETHGFSSYCFGERGPEGFAPCAGCLSKRLRRPATTDLPLDTCEIRGMDLHCEGGPNVEGFFDRLAYHLFNAGINYHEYRNETDFLNGNLVVSALLRKSLGQEHWDEVAA